jgi:RNA polymerase sigma factor (sigma-70 family)
MPSETDSRTSGDKFPDTRWSAIIATASRNKAERDRALDTLINAYWKPIYKYIRIKWNKSHEDAADLTQGFFAKAIEKNFFAGYDPAKSRFRTFLRICLDGFVANEEKASQRIKRGGGAQTVSLDFESVADEFALADKSRAESPDEYFEREWARSFFGLALDRLREEMEASERSIHFQLFQLYYLGSATDDSKLTHTELAARFGLSVTSVNNYLALARREFRRILLDNLREITVTDEEFRREARLLLGAEVE